MALEPGGKELHADIHFILVLALQDNVLCSCIRQIMREYTNLLFLKRLLNLLQVGKQTDVSTDLQHTDRFKISFNKFMQIFNADVKC